MLGEQGAEMGLWRVWDQRPTSRYVENLAARPVWNRESGTSEEVEAIREFLEEEVYPVARREYNEAARAARANKEKGGGGRIALGVPEKEGLNPTGSWTEVVLLAHSSPLNPPEFPETLSLLLTLPSVFASKLSTVSPATTILPHTGPTNARLRSHLCLLSSTSPSPPSLTVSDATVFWTEGEAVVFDDSFVHSVEYGEEEGGERVVLIVDFWHPELEEKDRFFQ